MLKGSTAEVSVALVVLVGIAFAAITGGRLDQGRDVLGAAVRAVLQLALVALVVAWIFDHPAGAVAYLAVMLVAATATSVRRIGEGRSVLPQVLLAISCGTAVTASVVVATGALPFTARTMLPFSAQIIGGSMTAVSLAASRLYDDVASQWEVVEGWLVLGATPSQAVRDIGRRAATRALIPALDQTRSAGLVVLPGAFVGMLLGGASPAQAAQVQLLALFGLIAAEALAVVLITRLLGPLAALHKPARIDA